jgi:hypothetical protein
LEILRRGFGLYWSKNLNTALNCKCNVGARA